MENKGITHKRGKIFMVVDTGHNLCYIGCTTEKYLSDRMAQYRRKYKRYINGEVKHNIIFDLFDKYGLLNCKIELIRYVDYTTKGELKATCYEDINRCDMCINNIQQSKLFLKATTHKQCETYNIDTGSETDDMDNIELDFNNKFVRLEYIEHILLQNKNVNQCLSNININIDTVETNPKHEEAYKSDLENNPTDIKITVRHVMIKLYQALLREAANVVMSNDKVMEYYAIKHDDFACESIHICSFGLNYKRKPVKPTIIKLYTHNHNYTLVEDITTIFKNNFKLKIYTYIDHLD